MSRSAGPSGKSKKLTRRNRLTALGFLLPNLIGFLAFTLIPILAAFGLCFFKWDFANPAVFVGFKNFTKLFHDETFQISLLNTLYYTAVSVPLTIIISLFIAVLLNHKIKGIKFFRTIYFFPYISSLVAVGVVWNMLLQPTMGPVNGILRSIGIQNPPGWTASTLWAMPAVILASVWRQVGYYTVIFLAGLHDIPEYLYEAATIDGAGTWSKFRYVTLPMLTPATFLVTLLLTISSFKVFDIIYIMTEGGPGRATKVLVYHIYEQAFQLFKFGYASAAAMVLFVIVLVLAVIQFKYEDKLVHYDSM
ncbi:MAG: sugar ABC transporter permease [Firmicutes bacterium]|nr:sugar ABC transporter permease [Bacillota bacterium]